jgi:hypothetical protein
MTEPVPITYGDSAEKALGERARVGHQGDNVGRERRSYACAATAVALGAFVVLCGLAPRATAEVPGFLTRMPAGAASPGSDAGELNNPRGISANPTSGRVYVSDLNNSRVNEYTAWGLFVKSWGWGVADGSAEPQTCGPPEPAEEPDPALCRAGLPGSGAGQISQPLGITVDPTGDIYDFELGNLRVQKFSAAGEFELMFGDGVNETTNADVCTKTDLEGGDVCGGGASGEGPSQLDSTVGNVIAYSSFANAIVVGDKGRIQIFNLDGTFREEVVFAGALTAFAGKSVNALDVDAAGSIYFSLAGEKDVYKISAAGAPLGPGKPGESKFHAEVPLGVAVDDKGNVYAIDDPPDILTDTEARVVKFDPAGNRLIPTPDEEKESRFFPYIPYQGPVLNGIATNLCPGSEDPGNLYLSVFRFGSVSHVDAYGTGPIGCESPPPRRPVIAAQFPTAVGSESATVRAQINPRFWPDTTYYVEYGTAPCSAGGCPSKAPATPALLTNRSTNETLKTALVPLSGLQPGLTYHFRFVSESGGGGPVFGVDPDGAGPEEASIDAGLERTFTTFGVPTQPVPCQNDEVRTGPSAQLPDCRAYEMVSPLDKEGGDVALWTGKHGVSALFFELHQSAPSGDRFTYSSSFAFAESASAPYASQYLAERGSSGWGTEAISPPRTESTLGTDDLFSNEFQAFSPDLCKAWVHHTSASPLAEGAIEGFSNLYRREGCSGALTYAALTTVEPPDRDPEDYSQLFVQGASADGTTAIFTSNDRLHPDAPTLPVKTELLLYESTPKGLRFVCYLPDGTPNPVSCGAGTAAGLPGGDQSTARNAVSADGSRIFWTAYDATEPGFGVQPGVPGQIYVRIDGIKTRAVSSAVSSDPAWYWTAADDGSKAIFQFATGPLAGTLYEFDVDSETATPIAKGVLGPMGASEDASRIYFASTEDLDDGGPAVDGARNLYLYEADLLGGPGTFTFVMELAAEDIGGNDPAPGPIDEIPSQRAARITPDGLHATFSAVASPPSGYDNNDAEGGEPAQEVYRYDATADELRCISCNPTGARPTGADIDGPFSAAARIQGWEALGHAPRVISDDGSRVFFESFEALVPRDTNGTWDVYQWEEPGKGGVGGCTEARSTFSEKAGGCVDLISSGESPAKSTFLDADPSGDNIFFSTQSSLVGRDYGLNDVYVARVGGGFPEPQAPPVCEGDACQGPASPPAFQGPASSSYRQPPAGRERPRCKRGQRRVKRAGKVRCVKKRKAGKRAAARRTGR